MKIELNTHERCMIDFAAQHPEVLVLSADLGSSCEIKKFRATYPDRYLTMGIAEQKMRSWAAGLAREGYRPFLHTFSVFLYRRILDQLEMSVAYPNLPVVFVGFVPGITTPGGVTHQSINDVRGCAPCPTWRSSTSATPPRSRACSSWPMTTMAPSLSGCSARRCPACSPPMSPCSSTAPGCCSEGDDVLILSSSICTEEAMRATAALKDRGVSVQHMHVSTLKPFTDPTIVEALKKVKYGVVTIENQYNIGGLSSAVSELIAENGINKRLVKIGLPGYPHGASKMYLMKKYGIDAMHLVQAVEDLTGRESAPHRAGSGRGAVRGLPRSVKDFPKNGAYRLALYAPSALK